MEIINEKKEFYKYIKRALKITKKSPAFLLLVFLLSYSLLSLKLCPVKRKQLEAVLGEAWGEGFEAADHFESGGDGVVGVVFAFSGGSEEGHDSVADELVHDAVVALDGGGHVFVIEVEQLDGFGGLEVFALGGESADVGEEYGEGTFDPFEFFFCFEKFLGDLFANVSTEGGGDAFFLPEACGHGVELVGEDSEFVRSEVVDVGVEFSFSHILCGGAKFFDGPENESAH